MIDPGPQHERLTDLLETLRTAGGFCFTWQIAPARSTGSATNAAAAEPPGSPSQPASEASSPATVVQLTGDDVPLLLERNGELLHAIESIAVAILRLAPEEQETLSVDAGGFKASRDQAINDAATAAIAHVRGTAEPFVFAPMNSRERRLLHLALVPSGLPSASSGEGPRRFVVLYPEGATPEPERFAPPPARPSSSRGSRSTSSRPTSGRNTGRTSSRNPETRQNSSQPNRPNDRPNDRPWQSRSSAAPRPSSPGNTLPGEQRAVRPASDPDNDPAQPGNTAFQPPPDVDDGAVPPRQEPSVADRLAKLRRNFRSR